MSVAKVLRLEEYRGRRLHRLSMLRSLSSGDSTRSRLFDELVEVAEVTGADRVAVVWIDEYGPGVVHAHLVVDLLSDRPRRQFALEPLRRAWDSGIPGTYEVAADLGFTRASTLAIALGSDGARGWFLVADSIRPRAPLGEAVRERLMFLAGECSSIVLHRDLDVGRGAEAKSTFPGWRFLEDLEGHESDEERTATVTRRFLVGRLVRSLLEEDLSVPDEQRAEAVERARLELESKAEGDVTDAMELEPVLEAYSKGDLEALGYSLLALGEAAERHDHANGALESFSCAFDLAAAQSMPRLAIDAARFSGRVLRRRAQWSDADRWYELALDVAKSAGLQDLAARSVSGLGLIKRDLGNLPAARERFEEALVLAQSADAPEALASVYHDLMGLEQMAGDLHQALRHGWRAVNTYTTETGRTRCMASMGGVLVELGDWTAAEDAYSVVTLSSQERYYLVYATDALGHISALRGDVAGYELYAARCDALDWENGAGFAKAEILLYRGLSCRALGRTGDARSWLLRAVDFAAEHRFSQVLFRAEDALSVLEQEVEAAAERAPAPPEVRDGLRAMHRELAEVGA